MTTHSAPLILGDGPRATDAAAIGAAITSTLGRVAASDADVRGIERLRVEVELDGDDIARLEIDATSVEITDRDGSIDTDLPSPLIATRTPGIARRVLIHASPITVQHLPVTVRLDAEALPFTWITTTDDRWGIEVADDAARGASGTARVAVAQDRLAPAAAAAVAAAEDALGVTITVGDVTVSSDGPRHALLRAQAHVKKGLLGAPVTALAEIDLDDNAVLTVRTLKLSSSNPLAAALIATVSSQIRNYEGKSIAINDALPAGLTLADARIEAGREIVVTASVA